MGVSGGLLSRAPHRGGGPPGVWVVRNSARKGALKARILTRTGCFRFELCFDEAHVRGPRTVLSSPQEQPAGGTDSRRKAGRQRPFPVSGHNSVLPALATSGRLCAIPWSTSCTENAPSRPPDAPPSLSSQSSSASRGANFDETRCNQHGAPPRVRICHPWPVNKRDGAGDHLGYNAQGSAEGGQRDKQLSACRGARRASTATETQDLTSLRLSTRRDSKERRNEMPERSIRHVHHVAKPTFQGNHRPAAPSGPRFGPEIGGECRPTSVSRPTPWPRRQRSRNLLPESAALGPILAVLAAIGPSSDDRSALPEVSPNTVHFWAPSVDIGPTLANPKPNVADVGRGSPEYDRALRSTSAQIWPHQHFVDSGPMTVAFAPSLADLVGYAPTSVDFDRFRPEFGGSRPCLGRLRAMSAVPCPIWARPGLHSEKLRCAAPVSEHVPSTSPALATSQRARRQRVWSARHVRRTWSICC